MAHATHDRPIPRRGLTLAEAVISIAIVGTMLVAALSTVGAAKLTEQRVGSRSRATQLAQDLMSEISAQRYADADYGLGSFGLGGDEVGDGSRSLWEDVDDYDGWSASPPQAKDGTEWTDLAGWKRSVQVDWVDPSDPTQVRSYETGAKRIVVTVEQDGVEITSLTGLRTCAAPQLGDTSKASVPENNAPVAVAEASRTFGFSPVTVTFSAANSYDPDTGDELSFSWDFGDGGTATGASVTHTFSNGLYTAVLTVADGRGGTDTDEITIKVF
ncbi:MAG: PKD domain-containing protein [Phycisphaerae bacterium]|nr:PKD domain-containing protein [Phycisphaerae bacterium]